MSCQVWWSVEDVVRADLNDEGSPPVRVFALKNEAREGTIDEVLLGRKDIICQPGTIVLTWNINNQFLPKYEMLSPRSSCMLDQCLNYEMW